MSSLKNKKIIISAGASGIGWATAKVCLDKGATVFICDIEDYSIWIDKLPQLDCIIYSNILQQVNDPTRLVKKQTDLLKKDAVLITLFSNINHWSFLKRFFNESDLISQVLCESEFVKRITPENISSIFNLTPFRLFDISAISSLSDKQECNEFIESLDSSLTNLGVDRIEKITVTFHKRRLSEDQNLFVREGDFVNYSGRYFEILTLKEPRWLFGQGENSFEIAAECVKAREGLFDGN